MKGKIIFFAFVFLFSFYGIAQSEVVVSKEYEEQAQGEYYSGIQLFRHREYDKALEQLEKVIKEYPQSEIISEAHLKIGEIKALQGKDEEAITAFKNAINSKKASLKAISKLIDLQFKIENYQDIISYLEKFLALNKGKTEQDNKKIISFLDKARDSFWRKHLYEEEVRVMDLITDNFPDTAEAAEMWLRKGNAYASPPFTEMRNALYTYRKEWKKEFPYLEKSIFCYQKVIDSFPHFKDKCARASYEIGVIYDRAKQYDEAIKYFTLAIDKFSFSSPYKNYDLNILCYLGRIYQERGDHESLEKIKERMLSLDLRDPHAYKQISNIFTELGWIDLSRNFFKKAIEKDPRILNIPKEGMLWFSDFIYSEDDSLALGDLNGDKGIEVVYAGKLGIFLLSGKTGEVIWHFELEEKVVGDIVLGDLDGDSLDDIVFSAGKTIIALKGKDGVVLWKASAEKSFFGNLVLGHFSEGKALDVAVVATDAYLFCFNGEDGREIWRYAGCHDGVHLVAGDINLDGIDDLVFGYNYKPHLLNGKNGTLLWEFKEDSDVFYSSFIIHPFNQDDTPDIVTVGGTKLTILDGKDGKQLLSIRDTTPTNKLIINDINLDGKDDILLVHSKDTSVFFDMGRDTVNLVNYIPCQFLIPRDSTTRKNVWVVADEFSSRFNIYEVNYYSKTDLDLDLKQKIPNEVYNWSENWKKSLVMGDINGDGKLEIVRSAGRISYAIKTNIPCVENSLVWSMSGLNYRYNQVIE